ncbi:MAG: HD domain-containing protein [bacterium]|nr:HD domain-containing protein [bacterium]
MNVTEENPILIVLHNVVLYDYFLDLLEKEPYKIFIVQNTNDALQILKNNKLKLVICEHHVPGLDGIEFFKKIKAKYPDVIRLMLSGAKEFDILARVINECEVYNILSSTGSPEEFKNIISMAVNRYNYMERYNSKNMEISHKNVELETLNIHLEERFYEKTSLLLKAKKELEEVNINLKKNLAHLSAVSAERDALYNDLQRSYIETLYGLVNAIEAKDTYTSGHTERVDKLVSCLADKIFLSEHDKVTLKYAAVLHDIGKIGIDKAILRKPGKLSEEEFDIIKKHPLIGEKIIEPIHFLAETLPLIRGHHEKLDGTGYPDGLKNSEISEMCRIITVADVFEALTSDRPYRRAMDIKDAFDIFKKEKDKYDLNIVKILEEVINDGVYEPEGVK